MITDDKGRAGFEECARQARGHLIRIRSAGTRWSRPAAGTSCDPQKDFAKPVGAPAGGHSV